MSLLPPPLPVVVAPLPWGAGPALHRGLVAALPPGTSVAMPRAGGSFGDAVAAVGRAARERGWPRVVVVSHSMASLVALAFALDAPDGVAGLVLVGAVAGREGLRDGLWRPGHPAHDAWLDALRALRAGGDPRAYVARLVELGTAAPEALPALRADLAEARLDPARLDAFFRHELPALDLAPRLGEVRAPALVLAGRQDPLCTLRQSEALAAALPRARLEVLDRCGHWPWHEQPEAFRAAVGRFLGALDGGADGGDGGSP